MTLKQWHQHLLAGTFIVGVSVLGQSSAAWAQAAQTDVVQVQDATAQD